jgi:Protein of unknown function (DUF2510)/Domain of unknown function (DUF4328)
MTDSTSRPPRGWYPDPGGTPAWRWWDGSAWSETTHPFRPRSETLTGDAVAREHVAGTRLRSVGIIILGIALLLGIVLRVSDVAWMAATWHWLAHAYDLAKSGASSTSLPPAPGRATGSSSLSTFVQLPLEIVALVLVLTFQHRAAGVAKSLGLRTRLSPTWGVVSWFIPVANLFLPLIAWLDLLPTRSRGRGTLAVAWALFLVSELLTIGVFAVASNSTWLVGLISGAQAIGFLIGLVLIRQVIVAVLDEHEIGASSLDLPRT